MQKKSKRIPFRIKLFWSLFFIFLSIHLAVWLTGYTYIYKTLIYTYPDIDDLDLFDSRLIKSESPDDWPAVTESRTLKLPAEGTGLLEELETTAFLVIRNDSICFESYNDGFDENTVSNSFSVAKSIVGILTGIAADEGHLKVSDPVSRFLPEFSEGENAKLRIEHLLQMSSGLNWDESYSSLFSKTTEAYYGNDLRKLISGLKVITEPGKEFSYMSCNTLLLGVILESATGMKLAGYAEQKLWNPVGAVHPAFWSLDKSGGIEKSYCCFYSTARDFARVGKLMLDSGMWNGKRIVSKEYIRQTLTPVNIPDPDGNPVDYYGYQWWLLNHEGQEVFYARGILGQYIVVIPEKRIVIVRLGKKRGEKLPNGHYTDLIAYVDMVIKSVEHSTGAKAN